ncbi:hypothetical protein [Criblamydia sequanensis]|uniref:Secreted protein n=1 Tax=Candidatus Criblamydia sequanensis CRIB-18 TaxID=1437425 RepID=A0A090CZF4_9BACT|nr:hypothetical protein [Criblamydia sequanensis]CDR34241.1 putative secreted protein [Criblamydia sequanensis CRIB-18]
MKCPHPSKTKKFMFKTIASLLVFLQFFLPPKARSQENDYLHITGNIRKDFEAKILHTYGLKCIGSGGSLMYNVKKLSMEFQHKGILNKNELRKLLIELTDLFLEEINNNEEIRPYLENYPFTPKNIDITIYIRDSQNQRVFYPNLCVASSLYGKLLFHTNDEANPIAPFYTTEEETYEEALEKLKQYNDESSF